MDRRTRGRIAANTARLVRATEDLLERIRESSRREAVLVARSHECIVSSTVLVQRVGRALNASPFLLARVQTPQYPRLFDPAAMDPDGPGDLE